MGRLIGLVVLIVVLYSVISQPLESARMTRNGASQLGAAGDRVVVFVTSLVGGTTRSDGVVPVGGVAAGDGSSAPPGTPTR